MTELCSPLSALSSDAIDAVSVHLVALLAGLPPPGLDLKGEQQSAALVDGLLSAWQILPSLSEAQLRELDRILAPLDAARLRSARLATTAFSRVQIAVAETFLKAIEASRIDYALLKGSATSRLLYPEPYMRTGWDLDIGVRRADLRRIEALAHDCRFVDAQQDPESGEFYRADPLLKAKVEAGHYELGFLVRRFEVVNLDPDVRAALRSDPWARRFWFDVDADAPRCYASIDVHHALSHDLAIEPLLTSAWRLKLPSGDVSVPDAAWLLIHLIFKIYWEGAHHYGKGLYQYADLVRLMPRVDAEAFGYVRQVLEEHRLGAAGYYVLRRLPLFCVSLSREILSFLEEEKNPLNGSDPIMINDIGDMWPKLFGLR